MRSTRWLAVMSVLLMVGVVAQPAEAVPLPGPTPIPRRPGPTAPVPRPAPSIIDLTGYTLVVERLFTVAPRPPRGATPAGPTRADIDGDGIDEIVIGSSGAVFVDYSGLRRTDLIRPSVWDNSTIRFGEALAAGDFNGDGYDDLAVGNVGDDAAWQATWPKTAPVVRVQYAGGVWVIPGGSDGVRVDQARHVTQDTPGVPSDARAGELLGWTVAAGDLNGDGRADLAVQSAGEQVDGAEWAGAVTVLYGSTAGLTTAGALRLDQSMAAVPGNARAFNDFGSGLAIGNVTGDQFADLVVGAPNDDDGIFWRPGHAGTGRIAIFKGASTGLSLTGVGDVTAWAAGLPPGADWPDPIIQYLGGGLAIGDITGDGYGEVVSTAYASQVGTVLAGAIVVLRGTAGGVTLNGRQVISENSPGVPGTSMHEQWFGEGGVQVGDLTGDGRRDVLISSFRKHIGGAADAGSVLLLPGTASGVGTAGARLFDQTSVSELGGPATDEYFGRYFGLANLDGRGALDALVATGYEQSWGQQGVVTVFGGGGGTLTPYGTVASTSYQPGFFATNFGRTP